MDNYVDGMTGRNFFAFLASYAAMEAANKPTVTRVAVSLVAILATAGVDRLYRAHGRN